MGVEYGFYSVSKYGKITLDDFFNVKRYLSWKENSWATENYPSYKKYWEAYYKEGNEKFPGIPDNDVVEYYSTHKEDEMGYDIERCLGFWCSIGVNLDKTIRDWLGMRFDEYTHEIDKEFVDKALEYTETQLEKNKLIPLTIVSDVGKVTLESEFGDQIELDLTGKKIYVESPKYDSDERYMLKLFRDVMYLTKQVDFDNNFVWYSRSW